MPLSCLCSRILPRCLSCFALCLLLFLRRLPLRCFVLLAPSLCLKVPLLLFLLAFENLLLPAFLLPPLGFLEFPSLPCSVLLSELVPSLLELTFLVFLTPPILELYLNLKLLPCALGRLTHFLVLLQCLIQSLPVQCLLLCCPAIELVFKSFVSVQHQAIELLPKLA